MTKKRQQVQELVTAFVTNKQSPNEINLDGLFAVIDNIDAVEVLIPVLEIAYEAIGNLAETLGCGTEEIITGMRRMPVPA